MTMMREYLQGVYDAIPFSIDAVRSRADWLRWRPRTLAALRTCLGLATFPPRTPLRPRVLGTLQRDGYTLERVVFETRPGFLMTSNLYRPAGLRGRAPGILCVHGHSMLGKTTDEVQLRSIAFARAGWVVLAVDATGHGERVHIGHRAKFAIVTAGLALEGIQVWDNMRAVDYLLSRPEVDGRRLGITGCSGGGNQTMYTGAMDERLGVVVPVCSVSTLRGQIFTPNSIGCDCECVPDLMRHGLENAVVCALVAPRRLGVLAGKRDVTFPIQYTRVANLKLRRFFEAIGCEGSYGYVEKPVTHGYHKPLREQAGAWFAKWFCPGTTGFGTTGVSVAAATDTPCRTTRPRYSEAGAVAEPPERIWCFPGGQLPKKSATLGTVAHAAAVKLVKRLRAPRTAARREALRTAIRDEVLGGFPVRGPLGAKETKPVRRGGVIRWNVTLASEPGITITASITRPTSHHSTPVILVGTEPSRQRQAMADGLISGGLPIVELSIRPMAGDEHASKAALVLGRPLVGMGAYDITRFMDYIVARGDFYPYGILWAEGLMTLPALYAMALDERIVGGTFSGLVSTYVSPAPVPHPTWTFARGLLKHADIDHLLALAAPRSVTVLNPVGADAQPLSPAGMRKAFPAARQAYQRSGGLRIVGGQKRAVV